MMENPQFFGGAVSSNNLPKTDGLEGVAQAFEASRRNDQGTASLALSFGEAYDSRIESIEAATGVRLPNPYTDKFDEVPGRLRGFAGGGGNNNLQNDDREFRITEQRRVFEEKVNALREQHPSASLAGEEDFINSIQARAQELEHQRGNVAFLPGLVGDIGASFTDPNTLATLPIGGSAKTILGAVLKESAASGIGEALLQPGVQEARKELGLEASFESAVRNVASATIAGGLLGGGVKTVQRGSEIVSRKTMVKFGKAHDDPELRAAALDVEKELDIENLATQIDPDAGPVEKGQAQTIHSTIERALDGENEALEELSVLQRQAQEDGVPIFRADESVPAQAAAVDVPATGVSAPANVKNSSPLISQALAKPEPEVKGKDGDTPKGEKGEAPPEPPTPERIKVDPQTAFEDAAPTAPAQRAQVQALAEEVDTLADDAVIRIEDGIDADGNPVSREITKAQLASEIKQRRQGIERIRACVV